VRRWCCRGRSLTRESRRRLISSPNCGNPAHRRPRAPSPTRRWRPSRRHSSQGHSSTSGRAARSLPCRCCTAARTGSSPPARRSSGYRSAGGGDCIHRPPQAAPGGRPRPASAANFKRPAASWLIFLLILYPRVSSWPGVL
jgi:hypothetical protein